MNQQNSGCPKCHLLDRSQKISALVEGGTVASVYSSNTYGVHVSGFTQSAKASQLAPRSAPTIPKSPWGCISYIFMLILYVLTIMFLCDIPFAIFSPDIRGADKFFGSIGCAIAAAICIIIIIRVTRGKEKVKLARQEQYRLSKPKWERAKYWWNQLYYCERDDIVFLPNSPNDYAPASQVWSLCERL